MKKLDKVKKLINKFGYNVIAKEKDDIIFLEGELDSYDKVFEVGHEVAKTKLYSHVVNNIKLKGFVPNIYKPSLKDNKLDKKEVDVLVIGGGVVGAAILRELSKYNLTCLLVEKNEDLALQASSRNDGCIHVGVDLHRGSQKLHYLVRSKEIIKDLCKDIDVEYKEDGQTVCFKSNLLRPLIRTYFHFKCKQNSITDYKILSRKKLLEKEPNLSEEVKFGVHFPHAGSICPYNFTIALAESAVVNGAEVSFHTIVEDMVVEDGIIKEVKTNRGAIYPKIVVNAAGVFSDDVADMAKDKFFSIHPRKGSDVLMDKSVRKLLSNSGLQIFSIKKKSHTSNSKGGGIIPTVDDNTLVGPNAVEVPDKEDYSTSKEVVDALFSKHSKTIENLKKSDTITYFSGTRAATYEEDFIVSRGKWTKNIIHAAGIQSPGLTAAPAIGEEIAKMAAASLNASRKDNFNPIRKGIVQTRKLDEEARDKLIKSNPKYGHIICRCEEISEGEIIDAIHSIIPPSTLDGIKRRVRAGMGRCQGGFCQPNVASIFAKENSIELQDVHKKGEDVLIYRDVKE